MPTGWTGEIAYHVGPDGASRPYLVMEFLNVEGDWRRLLALVDTGADRSVLPLQLAPVLGIDAAQLTREQGTQVVGSMDVWSSPKPVKARICGLGNEFDLNPIFIQGVQTLLLGRADFMTVWSVTVNEKTRRLGLAYLG